MEEYSFPGTAEDDGWGVDFIMPLCLALVGVGSSGFLFCDTDMRVLSADSR